MSESEIDVDEFVRNILSALPHMDMNGKFHRKIMEGALRCIKQLQDEIDKAKIGSFGFMIKKEENLQEGMARNYNEFDEERSRLRDILKTIQRNIKANAVNVGWIEAYIKANT